MNPLIVKTIQAREDLLAHYLRIGQDSPRAADRFLEAAEATLERIARMPNAGEAFPTNNLELAGVRQATISRFRNYLIFYRATEGGIEVLRIIHGARNVRRILDPDEGT